MHAKNFLVDNGCNRQTVETVSKSLPKLDVVSSFALVVEAVDTVDGGALVVASEEEEVLRILNFIGKQQAHCFKTLLASVHVVAQEQVVSVRREPSILE